LQIELTLYDPAGSGSHSGVTCGQDFCVIANGGLPPTCPSASSPCGYSIAYGDGSSTTGFFVTDTLHYNQVSGNAQTALANTSITFGCVSLYKPVCSSILLFAGPAHDSAFVCRCGAKIGGDLGSSNQALDGILGFGQANSSMLSQLANAGKVTKIFAHCLDTVNGGGIFAIGNVVQPKVKTTPLVAGMYVILLLLHVYFLQTYISSPLLHVELSCLISFIQF
jgi:hypothetical protein